MQMAAVGSVDRNLRAEDKEMVEEYQRNVGLLNGDGNDGDESMSGESMMVAGDHKTETHYHLPTPPVPVPEPPVVPEPIQPIAAATSPWVGRALSAALGGSILGGGMLLNSALNPTTPVVDPTPVDKTPPVAAAPKQPDGIGLFQLDR